GWEKQFTSYSISDSDDDRIANIAKGAISSSSIKKTNDGFEIAFAINTRPNPNNTSPHRSSGIVVLKLNNELKITNKIEKHLFQQNSFSDNTIENELWNGYFSNEVIAASGINATLNNDYLTPFVGIGWSKVLEPNKPWFVWLLKNPFDNSKTFYELSPNTNSNDYRIYRTKNSDFYKNWGNAQPTNQLEFGQLQCGIPLLEYNHDSTNSNQPFERSIFLTENNTSKAIMINQKDRDSSTTNQVTYSYHTRFENLTPSFTNFNQLLDPNMDNVTEQKIQDLINNTNNKDIFLRALNGKNIVSDATFAIRDIVFNFVSGTINFVLDITKYFDERGIFQSGTQTFNVTITAFNKKAKTTISDNVNLNDPTVVYNNIHSYNLIPTISGSYSQIDDKYWNFRFLVLTALKEKQSLFGRSNNFRNVNNLTITEQDFNKVFTKFEITNSNNANGSITVSFTIKKDYVYTDNEDLNDIVTFNGLRKINQTELISNNKENPLEIQSLSATNMPYDGNSWQYPTYTQGIQTITEDQLKQKLIEEVFNKDYEKATSANGFDSGIGKLTKHLPFLKTYKDQDANNITNNEIITKNNIVLSNYEFFAAKGILKVDVQLKVWNGTDNKLKHTERLGIEDANAPISAAPKATWYISGFKHDNVETKFDSQTVWDLSGLSLIKPNQFEEHKDAVKKSLLDCLKANQNLISFPYWVNKEEVLKTIDIEFDPDCKIDTTDKKQALLKVRFTNNMWEADEQGKVSDKITNAKWQTIKIRGFLNPEPIKLQTEKLKNIRLSGNTKVLTIDENETQTFEGVDQERKQYLEIQY
ncbi:MAG: hypothetical protein IJ970_01490, partial [Mycoplasmataceae bacterium]|nr:hypothetical protein [Mycoplasmataceae bacterium]